MLCSFYLKRRVCVCVFACVRECVCPEDDSNFARALLCPSLLRSIHESPQYYLKTHNPRYPCTFPLPTVQLFSIRSPSLASYLSFGIAITFFFIFVIGEACARCRLYLTSCSVLVGIYWFLCLSSTVKKNRVLLG